MRGFRIWQALFLVCCPGLTVGASEAEIWTEVRQGERLWSEPGGDVLGELAEGQRVRVTGRDHPFWEVEAGPEGEDAALRGFYLGAYLEVTEEMREAWPIYDRVEWSSRAMRSPASGSIVCAVSADDIFEVTQERRPGGEVRIRIDIGRSPYPGRTAWARVDKADGHQATHEGLHGEPARRLLAQVPTGTALHLEWSQWPDGGTRTRSIALKGSKAHFDRCEREMSHQK